LEEAANQYKHIFEMPNYEAEDQREHQRSDGARQLIQLLMTNYLPLQNIQMWKDEPENFIE